jgi:hypothetical protein
MIFVATGADASANNLGKISIKSVYDISETTKTILNYFGKPWSDDQKIAIDDFLQAFNASTWKSKVKIMYMPILMPFQNGLLNANIQSNPIFKKNISNWNVELILPVFNYLSVGYASLGVNKNGIVLQADSGTGTVSANATFSVTSTSFGITNKSAHYGIYFKATTKFRAGSASGSEGIISSNTGDSLNFYNNLIASVSGASAPKKQLAILNGDVTISSSKSYLKKGLVPTTIVNTQNSAVLGNTALITGGNDNTANDSTSCFMTFGNYMTDSELSEYGNLINTLMDVLVV